MPFRKSYKKKVYRKKRYYKKRGSKIARNKIGLIGPLTQRIGSKLCWESGQIGTTTSVAPGTFTIRMNSLYDPQYTVGGLQPRGYDEMMAIYGQYRVLGLKIKLYGQTLTSGSAIIGYAINSSAIAPGDVNSYLEARNKKFRFCTTDRPVVISTYTSMSKAFGISPKIVRIDDDYQAGLGANPARTQYLHLFWQNNDETTSNGFNIRCCLEFYAMFSHPNVLSSS